MHDKPDVSVILIFLNAEQFIRESIESVISQTYGNWELLLVDDGSTDKSTLQAKNYEKTDERIRYIEHPSHQNKGMSAARNLGISRSRGDYVAFIDSDDVWMPNKLEHQLAYIKKHPTASMTYGPGKWWYGWDSAEKRNKKDEIQDIGVRSNSLIHPPALLKLYLNDAKYSPCPSGILVKKEALTRVRGFEEQFSGVYMSYEDQAFYSKLCLQEPVCVYGECLFKYRQHKDSCVENVNSMGRSGDARVFYLNWLGRYLAGKNIADTELYAILDRERIKAGNMKKSITSPVHAVLRRIRRLGLHCRLGGRSFNSLRPASRVFGGDRGGIIDRYYIEAFLGKCAGDIKGRVLEVADNAYTLKFGGENVINSDILHLTGSPEATIVGDLSTGAGIPQGAFDCMILTQTLHVIYDVHAAVRNAYSALKPGGVLLATLPGISQISRYDMDCWGDYWRFTDASVKRLFGDVFGAENIAVEVYGNVLTSCAFLHGLTVQELKKEELEYHDPDYQLLITVRAIKKGLLSP